MGKAARKIIQVGYITTVYNGHAKAPPISGGFLSSRSISALDAGQKAVNRGSGNRDAREAGPQLS
jgi:hypothetical protein